MKPSGVVLEAPLEVERVEGRFGDGREWGADLSRRRHFDVGF